jgi:HPt (histidine-containing phosphotransfer) domain-containing protein
MADYTNQDLDLSLLNEIADGSDEFIVDTIDMFMQQTPVILQEIEAGLAANDLSTAGTAAHKLKATFGFFGMLNTQALIQQIESGCKTGTISADEAKVKLAEVNTIIAANMPALTQIQAEAKAKL